MPMTPPNLSGRITLVTGATRGIGWQACLALAKAGSHIIAAGRTQGALEELDDAIRQAGGESTLVPIDLRQFDAIDRLGKTIFERWGRLDGLFGNAGFLGEITPAPHTEPKIWDQVMDLNLTANYRLIRSLDVPLRASSSGRALFMSSGVAQSHRAYWGAYAASKAALDAFVTCYANETTKTNLKVNLLDPGAVRTQMRAKAMPGEDPSHLPDPADIAPLITNMLSGDYTQTAQRVKFRDTGYFNPA